MLARSASTPVLGALHASGGHSPAVHFAEASPTASYHPPVISCHMSGGGSDHERSRGGGMRRTCSDGNLSSLSGLADDHQYHVPPSGKCAPRSKPPPALSFGRFGFSSGGGGGSTFSQEHPLFLARGLGIDRLGSGLLSADGGGGGGGGGGGERGSYTVTSGNGGDRSGIEMHYKKLIEEDPCNGLSLRNYAQFLYQVKGDHRRAEEYYSRAILADQNDGELLSEYAKLIWDVHRDEERASSYFERAARASPQNSHVLAAQAAFLWDTDDGAGPEESGGGALSYMGFAAAHSSMSSATT